MKNLSVLLVFACVTALPLGPAAAATSKCYYGQQKITLPDGKNVPGSFELIRRTVDRAKKLIIEDAAAIDVRPNVPPRLFIVELHVSGNKAKLEERHGRFSGTGELTGPAWAWTGWRTESNMPDGMKVVSTDKVTEGGAIHAVKEVFGKDGKRRFTLDVIVEPIGNAECNKRFAEVAKKTARPPEKKPVAPRKVK